jgi:hypothetical protein
MSHEDQRRALLDLAYQLDCKEPLSDAQQAYLATVFYRIGSGEDANVVLQTRLMKGQKISDIDARKKMSFILHWIAGAIAEDDNANIPPISLEAALQKASTDVVPLANKIFGNVDQHAYDVDYLRTCWKSSKYAHIKSPDRGYFDSDNPYF